MNELILINYVTKDINPPNVPQARPIENFWSCLSENVYEGGWQASNDQQMINLCEIPCGGGQSKALKRKIGHDGIFAINFCPFTYASPRNKIKIHIIFIQVKDYKKK
ncbi:glucosylceramidase 4 [Brachionus plicatilis]|uniref:Glucosylceramidase 4 n=1 Tax=Brachionus plicatilis TaxID=10195 RepID=A0A3M7PW57_BRAPC|nr:glucosylceramidase 4 [Brachionus plicatilis]